MYQLGYELRITLVVSIRTPILDDDVLSIDVPEFAKPQQECVKTKIVLGGVLWRDESHSGDLFWLLGYGGWGVNEESCREQPKEMLWIHGRTF